MSGAFETQPLLISACVLLHPKRVPPHVRRGNEEYRGNETAELHIESTRCYSEIPNLVSITSCDTVL